MGEGAGGTPQPSPDGARWETASTKSLMVAAVMVNRLALPLVSLAALLVIPAFGSARAQDEEQGTEPIVRFVPRWDRQASGVTDNLFAVNFVNPSLGWAAGANNTILRTTNGGETWTRLQERRDR